jgi:hypothetical protein
MAVVRIMIQYFNYLCGATGNWFDYRLGYDPRFLTRIEHTRQSLRLVMRSDWKISTFER